jgi:hypothetical protein
LSIAVIFVTPGSSSWTVPTGLNAGDTVTVECWAAGSGGSGRVGTTFGSAGGGGAYASTSYTLTPTDIANGVVYTIGTGSNGTSGAASSAGGATSFSANNLNLLPLTRGDGAVVGTPGTLPPGWNFSGGSGLTFNVVATGIDPTMGLPYVDIQYIGTATGGNVALFFTDALQGLTTVTPSTAYTQSEYVQLVGGTASNFTGRLLINEYNGATYVTTVANTSFTLTSTLTRTTYSPTMGSTITGVQCSFNIDYTAGAAINATIRHMAPQFELGSSASAYKSTPGYTLAAGATGVTSATVAGAGGTTAASTGTTLFAGGAGAVYNANSSGGGGSGGPAGAGSAGNTSGQGGAADGSSVSGGAVKTTSPGNAGTSNSEGGGGGGGLKTASGTAGAGGQPGGGGGGASIATSTGGKGGDGQIRLTYSLSGTVVSNIHPNLSAWSNTTYTVGQRRSNNGQAYQCTTAGTSTAAPTGTGTGISNGGTSVWKWLSAIDYTTVQSWANALPSTLTQPVRGQLWNNGGITTTAGTAYLTLSGITTSNTNTITLTAAPGESFTDTLAGGSVALAAGQSNGVAFTFPAGTGGINYFDIETSNTFITGLQFIDTNSTSNCTQMAFGAVGNVVVRNCIFDGYGQPGGSTIIGYAGAGTGITLANCLIIDRAANPSTGSATIVMFSNPCIIANCTVYAPNSPTGVAGFQNQSTVTTPNVVSNSIFIGYTASNVINNSSTGTTAVDHSLFSNASLTGTGTTTGTGNLFSKTASNQFQSTTNDFRLKTGADAINAGAIDSTYIPTQDDIIGTARPQSSAWDIGAFEYINAGSVGTATGSSTASAIAGSAGTASATGSSTATAIAGSAGKGLATGSSTTAATSNFTAQSVGTTTGSSTATAIEAAQSIGAGSATGSNTASGAVGNRTAQSPATATGSSTTPGIGSNQTGSTGTATGSSTAGAIGLAQFKAVGSASGSSLMTGTAQGGASSIATATGISTTSATSISTARSVGSSVGTTVASAVSNAIEVTSGAATGSGSALGQSSNGYATLGSAAGGSTATAIGSSYFISPGTATAFGGSTAEAQAYSIRANSGQGSALSAGQATAIGFWTTQRRPLITWISRT